MAAATFDNAWCLAKFQMLAGRPASNDAITTTAEYLRLTEAQNRVIADMAARVPQSLYSHAAYGSTPTLSTTDNQVFTFGTDANGYAVFPIGKVGIYPSLAAIPDSPWSEGSDYLNEGTQIRIPNNRTYTATLYWRGITNPPDIDATHQPSIFPEAARELIVYDAVRSLASEGMRNMDLFNLMTAEYDRALKRWCLVWKTQFRSGGALGALTGLKLSMMGGYSTA